MTMKKMTICEQYDNIIAKAEGVLSADEIAFLKERAELHAKKNSSRKLTKAQEANESIKLNILEFMADGKQYTVTDIQKAIGLESNQKASALMRQLKDADLVARVEVKGRAFFSKI